MRVEDRCGAMEKDKGPGRWEKPGALCAGGLVMRNGCG